MLNLGRAQIQPIALDLGRDSVKLLQLAVEGAKLSVHAAARRVLDPVSGDESECARKQEIQAIAELMSGGDFHGRRVVAALPRRIIHFKSLRLPLSPQPQLEAVVHSEAAAALGWNPSEAQIEFLPAGEVRQGAEVRQEVIVLAARRDDVDEFVEHIHDAGLIVDSLDVQPCALYRGISRFLRRKSDQQEVQVLIDLGTHRSQLIIGRGQEIYFYKSLEIGGARLNENVSRKLGITIEESRALRRRLWGGEAEGGRRDPVRQAVFDATRGTMEELVREISLCLRYYSVTFRGQRSYRVRLLGGEANDPQLRAMVASVCGLAVAAGRPLFNLNCNRMKGFDRSGPSSEWALALGLGLRRVQQTFPQFDGPPREELAMDEAAELLRDAAAYDPMMPVPVDPAAVPREVVHA